MIDQECPNVNRIRAILYDSPRQVNGDCYADLGFDNFLAGPLKRYDTKMLFDSTPLQRNRRREDVSSTDNNDLGKVYVDPPFSYLVGMSRSIS